MNAVAPFIAESRIGLVRRGLRGRLDRALVARDVAALREVSAQAEGAALVSGDRELMALRFQALAIARFIEGDA